MKKNGWLAFPAVFFCVLSNYVNCDNSILFFQRFIYFAFFASLFILLRNFQLNKILKPSIAGISFLLFIYGVVQKFILFPIYLQTLKPEENFYAQALIFRIRSGRIFSLFRLPTLYAIICSVLILFLLHYLLKSESVKAKVVWSLLLALGVFNLLLTQSFGGLIYLAVGISAYLVLTGVFQLKYIAPVIMLFSLFLSLTIALRYKEAKKMEPIKLRLSNWHQAVRMVESSPFWGIGLGNYESKISYFTKVREARSIYAHNFPLQFIAETGIVLPFLLCLLLFGGRRKLKLPHPGDSDKILYISVLLILAVYNIIDIGFYFFPVLLTAVVILSQLYRNSSNRAGIVPVVLFMIPAALLVVTEISDNLRAEGDLLISQGLLEDAGPKYKKSMNINPYNFKAVAGYAALLAETDKLAETEEYLDKALALYPDASHPNYLKSGIQLRKGRLAMALYYASRAYKKNNLNEKYRKWYILLKKKFQERLKPLSQKQLEEQGAFR